MNECSFAKYFFLFYPGFSDKVFRDNIRDSNDSGFNGDARKKCDARTRDRSPTLIPSSTNAPSRKLDYLPDHRRHQSYKPPQAQIINCKL